MASCYNGGDWEWPQRSEVFSVYILLGRGGLRDSGQIQGIPEAVLSPTLPVILSFCGVGMECSYLRGNCYTILSDLIDLNNIGKFSTLPSTSSAF